MIVNGVCVCYSYTAGIVPIISCVFFIGFIQSNSLKMLPSSYSISFRFITEVSDSLVVDCISLSLKNTFYCDPVKQLHEW